MARNAFFDQLAIASRFGFEKIKSIQFVAEKRYHNHNYVT